MGNFINPHKTLAAMQYFTFKSVRTTVKIDYFKLKVTQILKANALFIDAKMSAFTSINFYTICLNTYFDYLFILQLWTNFYALLESVFY